MNPPAYDPQCNGLAEKAVQDVKAQLCVLKLGLEAHIEHNIPMESRISEWMIPHSADAVIRFSVGKDGRTPSSLENKFWQNPRGELELRISVHL